jgi:hypothetical protein
MSIRQMLVQKLQDRVGADNPKCPNCGKTMKEFDGGYKCPYCDKDVSTAVSKSVIPIQSFDTEEVSARAGLKKSLKVYSNDRYLGLVNQATNGTWSAVDFNGRPVAKHIASEDEIIQRILKHAGHPDQWVHTPIKYRLPSSNEDNPIEANVNDKLKEVKEWLDQTNALTAQSLGGATQNATIDSVHEPTDLKNLVNSIIQKHYGPGDHANGTPQIVHGGVKQEMKQGRIGAKGKTITVYGKALEGKNAKKEMSVQVPSKVAKTLGTPQFKSSVNLKSNVMGDVVKVDKFRENYPKGSRANEINNMVSASLGIAQNIINRANDPYVKDDKVSRDALLYKAGKIVDHVNSVMLPARTKAMQEWDKKQKRAPASPGL